MFRDKPIRPAVILAAVCLFFLCVHQSAAEITSMTAYVMDDYGGGNNVIVSLVAADGMARTHWYINGSHEKTVRHNDVTSVDMYFACPGHIKGTKYRVEVFVDFTAGPIDMEACQFRVYKPIRTSRYGEKTGVWGHARISRQYFDSTYNFGMRAFAYAYNGTTHKGLTAVAWFRQQEWTGEKGAFMDEKRDTKDAEPLEPGTSYEAYPLSTKIEFPHNRPMDIGDERFFNAHTHLQVSGRIGGLTRVDDWEADTEQQTGTTAVKFTHEDNPE